MSPERHNQFKDSPTFRPCIPAEIGMYRTPLMEAVKPYDAINARNAIIADALDADGPSTAADKLRRCHTELSSQTLSGDFRPTYYCRQPMLCGHCAAVRTTNITKQAEAALLSFGIKVNSSKLLPHKILIKPSTDETFDCSENDLTLAIAILQEFKRTLREYHKDHNSNKFVERLEKSPLSARELKRTTWGPTFSAIHLAFFNRHAVLQDYAHMHLTIYTDHRLSRKAVHKQVTALWMKTTRAFPGGYEGDPSEVLMPAVRARKPNGQQLAGKVFDISDGFDQNDQSRTGDQKQALSPVSYNSHLLKSNWNAAVVVAHYRLMQRRELGIADLQQFLGKESSIQREPPSEFDPGRLNHRYVLRCVDGEWKAYTRSKDASSAHSR